LVPARREINVSTHASQEYAVEKGEILATNAPIDHRGNVDLKLHFKGQYSIGFHTQQ